MSQYEDLSNVGRHLPSGYALGSRSAAMCALDSKRTSAFQRGLWLAIAAAQDRFPSDVIEVVYAGTGPFATLALPLMPMLDASRVRFTLIDVNESSTAILRTLTNADVITTDAARYIHPRPIHVVVTETMQQALTKEPFVAIVDNLRPQLAPGAFLVPERVTVTAAAIDAECEQARWNGAIGAERHVPLRTIAAVTRESTVVSSDPLVVPRLPASRTFWLALLTKIETFAGVALTTYESGLTMPLVVWRASPVREGDVIDPRALRG